MCTCVQRLLRETPVESRSHFAFHLGNIPVTGDVAVRFFAFNTEVHAYPTQRVYQFILESQLSYTTVNLMFWLVI